MEDRYKSLWDSSEECFYIVDTFCQNYLICWTYDDEDAENIVELLNLQDKGWLKIVVKENL